MSITATTVPIGSNIQGLAIDPATARLYMADFGQACVYVLDASNDYQLLNTIPVGLQPYSVAVDTARNLIYVVNQNLTAPPDVLGTLSTIDGGTGTAGSPLALPDIPVQVVVDPSTGDVYTGGSNITRIVGGAIVKSVVIGPSSIFGIAVNPVARELYIVSLGPHFQIYLVRFRLPDLTFVDQVALALNSCGVCVDPQTDTIYTTSILENLVQVWNGKDTPPTPITSVTVGNSPERVVRNTSSGNYYACNYWDNTVSVVSGGNIVLATVPVGAKPWVVDVDPGTNVVYTANYWGSFSYFTDTTGS
jgi:DNA-binding beta-propeller fold protein YncE